MALPGYVSELFPYLSNLTEIESLLQERKDQNVILKCFSLAVNYVNSEL